MRRIDWRVWTANEILDIQQMRVFFLYLSFLKEKKM